MMTLADEEGLSLSLMAGLELYQDQTKYPRLASCFWKQCHSELICLETNQ